ncbi:MAG: ribulose-phosphate 3-epimerase [Thermomicrobiales bacterium]|jgi:ribulose-phosphate 3-epimerase
MARTERVMLSPSILNSDLARLADSLALLEQAGADYVHLDVMDGRFVPNISIGIPVVASVREATSLPLDVHLMIVEPERYVEQFVAAGADIVTIQVEATAHPHRVLQSIREQGARAGLALNPGTPISHAIELLPLCDLVLIMSVNPGFGGQSFIPTSLRRLGEARAAIDAVGYPTILEVDGGITTRTAPKAVEAGATMLVAGTAIFGAEAGVVAALHDLRGAATARNSG